MGRPREDGVGEKHVGSNYSADEVEFLMAMDAYKTNRRRPFPTWGEVLKVLKSLGYRKVEESPAVPAGEGAGDGDRAAAETARPAPDPPDDSNSKGASCPSFADSPPS